MNDAGSVCSQRRRRIEVTWEVVEVGPMMLFLHAVALCVSYV